MMVIVVTKTTLESKVKKARAKRIQKQITKFGLTNKDIEFKTI